MCVSMRGLLPAVNHCSSTFLKNCNDLLNVPLWTNGWISLRPELGVC